MGRKVTGVSNNFVSEYETFQTPIFLVRGDTLPAIEMTLKDKNKAANGLTLDPEDSTTWAPYDLTGASILLKIKLASADEIKEEIPMIAVGVATNGTALASWSDTALDTAGKFVGEVEITTEEGAKITVYEQLLFIVREDY